MPPKKRMSSKKMKGKGLFGSIGGALGSAAGNALGGFLGLGKKKKRSKRMRGKGPLDMVTSVYSNAEAKKPSFIQM